VDKPHIGTLREKPLHASLKHWYSRDGDQIEVPVDGFVVDLVRDDLLIEIQTRNFSSMKQKLAKLLASGHRVRVVHPIAVDRWIVKVSSDGTVLSRRRSPKHGGVTDVFSELVSFPELLLDSGLEIEVVLTNEEEYRRHSEDRAWRRKGWMVIERRLLAVMQTTLIGDKDDLLNLMPDGLPSRFTTSDLSKASGKPLRVAQQMAYCLRKTGAIEAVGKSGNAVVYRIA
jgi:hypothetical protein